MMTPETNTIDEIKKEYEYTIDPYDFKNTSLVKYYYIFGNYGVILRGYLLKRKIEVIKKMMDNNKIDKKVRESYEKTLNEILDDYINMNKQLDLDFDEMTDILIPIIDDYKKNVDKPGAKELYLNISKDLIDKKVSVYIKNHKKLILYNELILDIYNYLTN